MPIITGQLLNANQNDLLIYDENIEGFKNIDASLVATAGPLGPTGPAGPAGPAGPTGSSGAGSDSYENFQLSNWAVNSTTPYFNSSVSKYAQRFTDSPVIDIHGFVAGIPYVRVLKNDGVGSTMTIYHLSGSASPGNQIYTNPAGTNVAIPSGQSVWIVYDLIFSRWQLIY